ncbi:MAG: redoxin domain-containing protein [bacterium]|nr:redoxin domain-containing protein [bacterium]
MPRFRAAHTQVLGVSIDSVFSHANWGQSLGGVSFPLLADFHPKGEMAKAYGLYLDNAGITDRATVVIDAEGVVRHASSVTPAGRRDIGELAALCEQIDSQHGSKLDDLPKPQGIAGAEMLYVKSSCGHSRKVLLARDNLHLADALPVKNVTDDATARDALVKLAGKDQAPCLIVGGKPVQDTDAIVQFLVTNSTDLG